MFIKRVKKTDSGNRISLFKLFLIDMKQVPNETKLLSKKIFQGKNDRLYTDLTSPFFERREFLYINKCSMSCNKYNFTRAGIVKLELDLKPYKIM